MTASFRVRVFKWQVWRRTPVLCSGIVFHRSRSLSEAVVLCAGCSVGCKTDASVWAPGWTNEITISGPGQEHQCVLTIPMVIVLCSQG